MLSDAGNLSGVARGNERLKRKCKSSSLLSGTPAIRALFSEIEVEKEQTHCVALRFCSSVGGLRAFRIFTYVDFHTCGRLVRELMIRLVLIS